MRPKLLVLDEPTAPLGRATPSTLLFERVRDVVAAGTAVVYITHRLAEVRELADRVTVLRDGRLRGTSAVAEISDDELLALIIGRKLDSTFPPKHDADADEAAELRARGPDGTRVRRGQRLRSTRGDHRHRRRGRQRAERAASCPGRPGVVHRAGRRRRARCAPPAGSSTGRRTCRPTGTPRA